MVWYKKQLKALRDAAEAKQPTTKSSAGASKKTGGKTMLTGKQKRQGFASSNPVAQRNRNRPKTDLY